MLHEFLAANARGIIARARDQMASRMIPVPTEAELKNGAPLFLSQLIDRLRLVTTDSGAIERSAALHGGELLAMGFTVSQVVHGYGDVCQVITQLAAEEGALITAKEFHAFNLCLDDAIAHAVTAHQRRRDEAVAGEGAQRLREALQVRNEAKRAFLEAANDYPRLVETVARRTAGALGDACLVALVSDDGHEVTPAALFDGTDDSALVGDAVAAASHRLDASSPARRVLESGVPLVVLDPERDRLLRELSPAYPPLLERLGTGSLLLVPLRAHGRSIGILFLSKSRVDDPLHDDRDRELALDLADHAAVVIQNARLIEALKREVAERKRAEEDAGKFVALVENSRDFIAMTGFDEKVSYVNEAGRKLIGLESVAEATSKTITDCLTDDARTRHREVVVPATTATAHWEGESELRHFQTGRAIEVLMSSFLVRQPDTNAPMCLATIMRDLTAVRALEEQFRQAQKMEAVGRLAGGVAHDFNNLLSVILGYASMLKESFEECDPRGAEVEEIVLASKRAVGLTRQLLAFSRQQIFQPHVVDLNRVIDGMEGMLRRLIREDIELATRLSPVACKACVDPGKIEQVIMNLVVNARDAMPDGGKLTIDVANVTLDEGYADLRPGVKAGPYVKIAVSDTGCGMDPATQARIFEPFFTTKAFGLGTGLGLSVTFGIVHQSGGYIWVYSEPGKGTVFRVYLPRLDGADAVSAPGASLAAPALNGSESILLVEDDEQLRVLTGAILSRAGYEVREARDAVEAELIAAQHLGVLHLLVTDVVMPGVNGRQLAERLAAVRPEMRILYMSGYTDNSISSHGVLARGVALLEKPFTPTTLTARVREVLDAPPCTPAA